MIKLNKILIMKNVMKYVIVFLFMLQVSIGQMTQDGMPYSHINDLSINAEKIILDPVDVDAMLEEDSQKSSGTPYRYGYIHKTAYSPSNSGQWTELEDGGRIWQIYFKSSGAHAISFEYEEFFIPKGSQLHVYNPGHEMVYGAYTYLNNSVGMGFDLFRGFGDFSNP